jgi:pyruvate kinase
MARRTKIVATLGPATSSQKVLDELIGAGVDVARINLSHGSHEEHRQRVEMVRDRARASGRQVGILVDLQGPKIRIGRFRDGPITLNEGEEFILDAALPLTDGDQNRVGLTYKEMVDDLGRGDTLILADGAIELRVNEVEGGEVRCRVVVGGELSDNKGINRQGGGLSAPALTDKDREDIKFAAAVTADYIAVSFVCSAEDVREARRLLREAGGEGGVVAKIERAEALECSDEIITASDAIMIARGDLGVEIGDAELPSIQKRLIKMARERNIVAITATQMMDSMIHAPIPTRAEVFDVANAVLDGTDAVMLSAETAAGKYPVRAVEAMSRVCREAEKNSLARRSHHRLNSVFGRIDEAIAMATMYTANHLGVVRQLLDHAAEHGYGMPAFNVNNMEQVQAIMEAAARPTPGDPAGLRRRPQVRRRALPAPPDPGRRRDLPAHPGGACTRTTAPARRSASARHPVRLHLGDDGRLPDGRRQDPRQLRVQRGGHPQGGGDGPRLRRLRGGRAGLPGLPGDRHGG